MWKFVPRSRVVIFHNELTRSTPLDPKLMFWCVSYYLGVFGTILLPYKLGAKRAELVQKLVPRSHVGIFRNEQSRSNPLDPKLMFWCVLYHLGAFGTVWLPYKTRCKTGQNWCKSSCHEVASEFFATKAPDLPHWTINSHFGAFRTIQVHLGPFWLPYNTQYKTGQTGAIVRATKSCWNFSQWTHPIHPIGL